MRGQIKHRWLNRENRVARVFEIRAFMDGH